MLSEVHQSQLESPAGMKPVSAKGVEPWMIREWRRISIPEWQRIIEKSIDQVDRQREDYARWMPGDILVGPEYEELGV